MERSSRGFRHSAHTADVAIDAWGPTRAACVEQAVTGAVASFAVARPTARRRRVPIEVTAGDDPELLVAALEEVVYRLDADTEVVVGARLRDLETGSLAGSFDVVRADDVDVVGAPLKGISRSDLRFGRDKDSWRCHVVLDV